MAPYSSLNPSLQKARDAKWIWKDFIYTLIKAGIFAASLEVWSRFTSSSAHIEGAIIVFPKQFDISRLPENWIMPEDRFMPSLPSFPCTSGVQGSREPSEMFRGQQNFSWRSINILYLISVMETAEVLLLSRSCAQVHILGVLVLYMSISISRCFRISTPLRSAEKSE